MSFEESIKNWVAIDNEIKNYNNQLKDLRDKRSTISNNIINFASTNNLNNATIQISNGKLRFVEVKQQNPLTYKFIEECLSKCINNEEQVNIIMNFIREQREIKTSVEIKRHYTDKS